MPNLSGQRMSLAPRLNEAWYLLANKRGPLKPPFLETRNGRGRIRNCESLMGNHSGMDASSDDLSPDRAPANQFNLQSLHVILFPPAPEPDKRFHLMRRRLRELPRRAKAVKGPSLLQTAPDQCCEPDSLKDWSQEFRLDE